MREIFLMCSVLAAGGVIFWYMKKLDGALKRSSEETGSVQKEAGTGLGIGVENPFMIGSLTEILERYCTENRRRAVRLYSGSAAQLKSALENGKIQFGIFSASGADAMREDFQSLCIPLFPAHIHVEEAGLPVELFAEGLPNKVLVVWSQESLLPESACVLDMIQNLALRYEKNRLEENQDR